MKKIIPVALLLMLFMSIGSFAQNTVTCVSKHPDPGATQVGTSTVTVTLSSSGSSGAALTATRPTVGSSLSSSAHGGRVSQAATTSSETNTVAAEFFLYKTSSGEIDYVFDPSSVKFSGTDCSKIDAIPTIELFDQISNAIVMQGVQSGQTPCTADCLTPTVATRVYSSSCVQRIGKGCSTTFICCSANSLCERDYAVCCPNGVYSAVITLLSVQSTGCDPGAAAKCEPLCP